MLIHLVAQDDNIGVFYHGLQLFQIFGSNYATCWIVWRIQYDHFGPRADHPGQLVPIYPVFRKFELCDLVVYPKKLRKYNTFLEKDLDAIFDLGYREAKKQLGEVSDDLPETGGK